MAIIWPCAGNLDLQRQRAPASSGRDLRAPRCAVAPGYDPPVRDRLPGSAVAVQLQGTRRVPDPAAVGPGAGAPGGTAADAGRGARRVGGTGDGGDPALRLR